ncbi:hypothetical protein [Bacillus clarus]|uniref:Uncharacterized protein n=1 Tax=Bacillus clarus TaxID=2338372 RepID=A0A090YUA8_9BACI|nr:hypothetical protein DJ93_4912 [Bacillus clarus]
MVQTTKAQSIYAGSSLNFSAFIFALCLCNASIVFSSIEIDRLEPEVFVSKGVVQEVKTAFEQLETEFDIPEEKIQTREEKEQADREVIDAFIVSGLAPSFDGMPKKLPDIVKRRLEGESYLKIANELDMSSGQIIEVIDEYRKRVAPLALKWHEWKEKQPETRNIRAAKGRGDG